MVLTQVLWLLENIPRPQDIPLHQFSHVPADALTEKTEMPQTLYITTKKMTCASVENMRLTSRWRRLVSVVGHHLSSHSNQILIQHRVLCLSDLSNLSDLFPLTLSDCENCQIGTGFCSSLYRCIAICARLHARICGSSVLGRVSGCWSGCVGVSSGSQGLNIWRPARALLYSY